MNPEQLFEIAGQVALPAWCLLAAGLFAPDKWAARLLFVGGRVVPVLLSAGYVAAMAVWWGEASGGFGSLNDVATLFTSPGLLLAGWVHYLAFDLWLGHWQVEQARAGSMPWALRALVLPCLFATLMFGPGGLLLFLLLAAGARRFTFAKDAMPWSA